MTTTWQFGDIFDIAWTCRHFSALGGNVHGAYLGHIGGDGGGGLEPPGGDRRWGSSSWSRVPGGTCVRIGKRGRRNENVAGRGYLGRSSCVLGEGE